jgi:hypothetical protein
VRLKYGMVVECTGCEKDAEGRVVQVLARVVPDTKSGTPGADAVKVKGTITWVGVHDAVPATVVLYDRLFTEAQPDAGGRDFREVLNPLSKQVVQGWLEPALAAAKREQRFQFERHGYFVADRIEHEPGARCSTASPRCATAGRRKDRQSAGRTGVCCLRCGRNLADPDGSEMRPPAMKEISMPTFRRLASSLAAACLACSTLPSFAAGQVEVAWIEPDHFADAGRSVIDRERTMSALGDHLKRWARLLPDGQTLKLEVLDLNLAGEIEPYGWHQVRVLRGRADWPQMKLRYTLQNQGNTLKAGDADLADMHYRLGDRTSELAFEKRMLDQWFKKTIASN